MTRGKVTDLREATHVTVGENGVQDVAALLAAGLPEPPSPTVLTRADGFGIFYRAKVNVLFGDPECGKSWIAYASAVEALGRGERAAVFDLDHNGARDVLRRLLDLGANPAYLADPDRFVLVLPLDGEELVAAARAVAAGRPAVAVVDSLGEVLPILGLSSNSPDDYTSAHRAVLTPLADGGAAVVAVDHLPKSDDARAHGQTGTLAKRRAVSGASLRVTLHEAFTPTAGGTASLTIDKDRPGGLRAVCPAGRGRSQPAGRFVLTPTARGLAWHVTAPDAALAPESDVWQVRDEDIAALDEMDPPPESVRDVRNRLRWGDRRAQATLSSWRRGGRS